jgi:cell division protein FtsB
MAGGRGKAGPPKRRPAGGRKPLGARRRARLRGRLLLAGVLLFAAFLYWRPLISYGEARASVADRRAEVAALRTERTRLERRLRHATSVPALEREARRIGFVRPGERLFVVKGIPAWRQAQRAGGGD